MPIIDEKTKNVFNETRKQIVDAKEIITEELIEEKRHDKIAARQVTIENISKKEIIEKNEAISQQIRDSNNSKKPNLFALSRMQKKGELAKELEENYNYREEENKFFAIDQIPEISLPSQENIDIKSEENLTSIDSFSKEESYFDYEEIFPIELPISNKSLSKSDDIDEFQSSESELDDDIPPPPPLVRSSRKKIETPCDTEEELYSEDEDIFFMEPNSSESNNNTPPPPAPHQTNRKRFNDSDQPKKSPAKPEASQNNSISSSNSKEQQFSL